MEILIETSSFLNVASRIMIDRRFFSWNGIEAGKQHGDPPPHLPLSMSIDICNIDNLEGSDGSGDLEGLLCVLEAQRASECLELMRVKAQLSLQISRAQAAERSERDMAERLGVAELRASEAEANAELLAERLDRSVAEAAGLREGMKALQEVR